MTEHDDFFYGEANDSSSGALQIPDELAVLPLLNMVVYPLTVAPLAVGQEASIRLIDDAVMGQRIVALVALKNQQRRPGTVAAADFYAVGTAAIVHRLLRLPDKTLRVALQGIERIQIDAIVQTSPYLRARVRVLPDHIGGGETMLLTRNLVALATQMLQLLPNASDEVRDQIANEDDPSRVAYLVAMNMLVRSSTAERQAILELPDVGAKLQRLSDLLTHELQVLRNGQIS